MTVDVTVSFSRVKGRSGSYGPKQRCVELCAEGGQGLGSWGGEGVQALQREWVRGDVGVRRGWVNKIGTADSDHSDVTEGAQGEIKLTRMRQDETF